MKIRTAELKGMALDWALAKALGRTVEVCHGCIVGVQDESGSWQAFAGHTDPATCLGLIGAAAGMVRNIHVAKNSDENGRFWVLGIDVKTAGNFKPIERQAFGSTLQIAVARCVVQMRLGDEVDVPDELKGERS